METSARANRCAAALGRTLHAEECLILTCPAAVCQVFMSIHNTYKTTTTINTARVTTTTPTNATAAAAASAVSAVTTSPRMMAEPAVKTLNVKIMAERSPASSVVCFCGSTCKPEIV
ncbi:hypothetical protein E2C01_034304 [Portunus trituberculatus]|uniref:Uncharacterized protein n=1 Tax=Portunus trituberculatus TaxID=210409 RepID=A0A5B7F6M4_PORTR|nr:hypothetical protein [Portunus trituberculatus]